MNTIIRKNHNGAIITINDLASGMLWMRKVESTDAKVVRKKICDILEEIRPYIKTLTSDNGKESADYQFITDEYYQVHFVNPYYPWERGANKYLIGLARQYFPKSTDFESLDDKRIQEVQNKLNERPRKKLCFDSSIFEMEKLLFNPSFPIVS